MTQVAFPSSTHVTSRSVYHRYSHFRMLHAALALELSLPSFPSRKLLFHSEKTTALRREQLEGWLRMVLRLVKGICDGGRWPRDLTAFLSTPEWRTVN